MNTATVSQESSTECPSLDSLRHTIEHLAHLLPSQGPITVFVHHNTLHAYEEVSFAEAARLGSKQFGCETYYPESRFRAKLARGRISLEDLAVVLRADLGDRAQVRLDGLGTVYDLRHAMLCHPLHVGPTAELRWVIAETDALRQFRDEVSSATRERIMRDTRRWIMRDLRDCLDSAHSSPSDPQILANLRRILPRFNSVSIERWDDDTWTAFCLHLLWQVCAEGVAKTATTSGPGRTMSPRHRDWLMEVTGEDTDRIVHEFLIPFCSVFLDQGISDWTLPRRDEGFFKSFIALYGHASPAREAWLDSLWHELRRMEDEGTTALASIAASLRTLGIGEDEQESFLAETMLALRGFGGMIWQLETRGDRVARPMPTGSLVEFLAIRLLLDTMAVRYLARERLDYRGSIADLKATLQREHPWPVENTLDQRAFQIFQLSQLCGWTPEALYRLSAADWTSLLQEVDGFSDLERRRIFQLAFERQYRVQALDAISLQAPASKQQTPPWRDLARAPQGVPVFQLITCIDDREESFRRYVEEIEPAAETFGTAGFFAAAMYYRGNAEAHYVPLCPIIVRPQHFVQETVSYTFAESERLRRRLRQAMARVTYRMHAGSRTLLGGALAGLLGSLATLPLVMRILFPRITSRIRRTFGQIVRTPPVTQLQLERTQDPPGPEGEHIGFSVNEMADIVERLLRDIGLTNNFSRIILLCGHGSSSLNNPHESAYNCGACAGARGGPNARAFAQMANDPRVRQALAARDFPLLPETIFIGAYHNTCDDNMTWFDLDRVPLSHQQDLHHLKQVLDEARARNAHERCRRFESAPLNQTIEAALRHVEGRSEDLSQARPEYNHATNAMCLVGRRAWSRGLYLDRRAFLQSYDPTQDTEDAKILTRILQAVIPVCAGISLEYYFSSVDYDGWGAGNKLPHNIVALLGVMEGAMGDLKPGLYRQMVEIHEPMRLLFVIETTPAKMQRILEQNPAIARLCYGEWVQLATLDPHTSELHLLEDRQFRPHVPSQAELPQVKSSMDWYRGSRDNLGFARLQT